MLRFGFECFSELDLSTDGNKDVRIWGVKIQDNGHEIARFGPSWEKVEADKKGQAIAFCLNAGSGELDGVIAKWPVEV
ncbi:hypothetical protein ACQU0X_09555 [Pseudovibrio ascidiaceicola]|uniref:hypothetical protein n=1 Tax=Pseudovibrio ascidiaceicola TaxID=285279 RepID=UPI003D3610EB